MPHRSLTAPVPIAAVQSSDAGSQGPGGGSLRRKSDMPAEDVSGSEYGPEYETDSADEDPEVSWPFTPFPLPLNLRELTRIKHEHSGSTMPSRS